MAKDRLDAAENVARKHIDVENPNGVALRYRQRPFCYAMIHWVLYGDRRPAGMLTPFAHRLVGVAVRKGLEHAYGEARQSEIPPEVFVRYERL